MDDVTRRRAVGLAAAGAAAALAAGSTRAQQEQYKKGDGKRFSGRSRKGSFDDALADAIAKARASDPGAGRQVRWALKEVAGVNGGIHPLNILTVEIEATVS
jgi:hypothetical protein